MSVSGFAAAEHTFPAEPTAVGRARRAVRTALHEAGGAHLRDAAELVVSELVTNSLVHAGTQVSLRILAEADAVRVEVKDGSPHLPVRRGWSHTAGTGRGLLIVEDYADRWGTASAPEGKVVWFEIGQPSDRQPLEQAAASPVSTTVEVTLLGVPLLMQWAWQEHASSLLREFLLFSIEEDPLVLTQHAAASDALSLLNEQLPTPHLPVAPDVLMASLVEPAVTAEAISLHLPASSIQSFEVLDDLLSRAVVAARQGWLLGAPTQPEIGEMRRWLCGEVARQARGMTPVAWLARTDVRSPVGVDPDKAGAERLLGGSDDPVIATSDAGVILAVTPQAVELLGYGDSTELTGRRVLVVIPERYHQAHIAGTTLHATHGRDALLDKWVTVPVLHEDGSEVPVEMRVESIHDDEDRSFFVAHFRVEGAPPQG